MPPLSRVPQMDGCGGPQRVAAEAETELRTRAQSWASPPGTRGWPAHCGRRPRQMGPWGQRRSACRLRTGSRRVQTGPRWKAGGSGGGTRGRCSHGHPGDREGTVRGAAAAGSPQPPWRRPRPHEVKPTRLLRAVGGRCWAMSRALDLLASLPEIWARPGPLALLTDFIPTSGERSCPGPALKFSFPFTCGPKTIWAQVPAVHLTRKPCLDIPVS